MNATTRRYIAEIARRHDLLVIEDSAYACLETEPPCSFIELMPERTIYVGGFSKNVATGLRLGYLVSPEKYLDTLVHGIRATTWNAPALIASLVTGWVEDGTVRLFEAERRADGARRQELCRKLLWNTAIVSHRNAGYAWIPLPNGIRVKLSSSVSSIGGTRFQVALPLPFPTMFRRRFVSHLAAFGIVFSKRPLSASNKH